MIRAPRSCRIVFDGQSHTNVPDPMGDATFGWAWTRLVMVGRGIPTYWRGIGGTSFTDLATDFSTRVAPWFRIPDEEPGIYVLCGGTQDILDGDSGAQVYSDAGVLADLARDSGAQYVICTTIPPAGPFDTAEETARLVANSDILADASGYFDDTIDFNVPGLDDPTDTRSFAFDQVHLWGGLSDPFDPNFGTGLAASVANSAINAAIAAVTA